MTIYNIDLRTIMNFVFVILLLFSILRSFQEEYSYKKDREALREEIKAMKNTNRQIANIWVVLERYPGTALEVIRLKNELVQGYQPATPDPGIQLDS